MNGESEKRNPQLQEVDGRFSRFLILLLVLGIPLLGILATLLRN